MQYPIASRQPCIKALFTIPLATLKGNSRMSRSPLHRFGALVLLFLIFASGSLLAQTATLTGQVLDPSGAAIPNATITVNSAATGITRTTTSTGAGLYTFAALPPAIYKVTVNAPGFTAPFGTMLS
jgi:hypothetical protein